MATVAAIGMSPGGHLAWHYLDDSQTEYGPVSNSTMREWYVAGMFPTGGHLRVRLTHWLWFVPVQMLFPKPEVAFLSQPCIQTLQDGCIGELSLQDDQQMLAKSYPIPGVRIGRIIQLPLDACSSCFTRLTQASTQELRGGGNSPQSSDDPPVCNVGGGNSAQSLASSTSAASAEQSIHHAGTAASSSSAASAAQAGEQTETVAPSSRAVSAAQTMEQSTAVAPLSSAVAAVPDMEHTARAADVEDDNRPADLAPRLGGRTWRRNWRRCSLPDGSGCFFLCEEDGEWFLEDSPGEWEKYIHPITMRPYWCKAGGRWFYC